MKGFTIEQHKKTGRELQALHDSAQDLATVISGAYPKNHRLCRTSCIFNGGPGSPLYDLRECLNNLSLQEQKPGRGTEFYFAAGSPGYSPPALLPGLPVAAAQVLNRQLDKRKKQARGKEKQPLSPFEIACFIKLLNHIGNRVAVIGIGIVQAYFPGKNQANHATAVLDSVKDLVGTLLDQLQEGGTRD